MHTLLAKRASRSRPSDYPTFTAEIASTMQRAAAGQLHASTNARPSEEKLFYLGQQMEQFRGTFFRQTMFAEFELAHPRHGRGRARGCRARSFTAIYLELLTQISRRRSMQIDPALCDRMGLYPALLLRLLRLPICDLDLRRGVLRAERAARRRAERERYLDVLRAGGSDYPVEILRRAGLDMTTPAPYQALIAEFGRVLDEAEALLGHA